MTIGARIRRYRNERGIRTPSDQQIEYIAESLKAWKRTSNQLAAGEVNEDDYEAWKARFRG